MWLNVNLANLISSQFIQLSFRQMFMTYGVTIGACLAICLRGELQLLYLQ